MLNGLDQLHDCDCGEDAIDLVDVVTTAVILDAITDRAPTVEHSHHVEISGGGDWGGDCGGGDCGGGGGD